MRQSRYESREHGTEDMGDVILHFVNGRLQFDTRTCAPSGILVSFATIYSDEPIGEMECSDLTIGYNENQQVWVTIQNDSDEYFEWGNWESERKVAVLFYVLTYDSEYLLFCNNKDFFCYLTIPQKDPRRDRNGRIPNSHFQTTYHVLDKLLEQTNRNVLKMIPTWLEG